MTPELDGSLASAKAQITTHAIDGSGEGTVAARAAMVDSDVAVEAFLPFSPAWSAVNSILANAQVHRARAKRMSRLLFCAVAPSPAAVPSYRGSRK